MKNLIIFLALVCLHFSSYSQKKKARPIPLPPPKESIVEFLRDTLSLRQYALPILFQWKMNADTTLKPNTVFKELIKLTYGQTEINGEYSLEPLTLKKSKPGKAVPEINIPKKITRVGYYDAEISNGVVILKGERTLSLKIFYDKNMQVSYLKDLASGAIYKHIPSEEHPVTVRGH
nr:hypothetical protein [Pedobacter sp. ASV19]